MTEAKTFKREQRYYVLKRSDLVGLTYSERLMLEHLLEKARGFRTLCGKGPLECVVVEHDWPEYQKVWAMIEQRVISGVKHNWRCVSPGEYDSTYYCPQCERHHVESTDNPASVLPEYGCKEN